MRFLLSFYLGLACLVSIQTLSLTGYKAYADTAHIAVATNFKQTVLELARIFEKESGHILHISAGSTGKLYAQIKNGAPFDLFLAADQARPDRLMTEGLGVKGTMFAYAFGHILLYAPKAQKLDITVLQTGTFRHLSVSNPKLAPYGRAALEVIQNLQLENQLKHKLVYGENIAQSFAFIQSGHAELGFIAKAQWVALGKKRSGAIWIPPKHLYQPITQAAILLERGNQNRAAIDFIAFLKSEDAKVIIRKSGYDTL